MENYENIESMDNFNWYYKDQFKWSLINYSKNKSKRIVFVGNKIDDSKFTVVIKKIRVDNNYQLILKEIYFLACCRKCIYFIKLIDLFLSDDNKFIFLVLKDEGESLEHLINYTNGNKEGFDYTKIEDMIKWTIFQIVCGLYILHKNKLVHHDIKLGNVLISSTGVVKIADFGSVDKIDTKGNATIFYESPNILIGKKATDKDDMWAVGVIMIELYRKSYPYFNFKQFSPQFYLQKEKLFQLKSILTKYKLTTNNNVIDVNNYYNFINVANNILSTNSYELFNFKEELNIINEIKDPEAVDLISGLLRLNPEKRFSAEEALNSKFLSKYKEYKDQLKQYKISFDDNDYINLLSGIQNENIFLKNVKLIKQKFIGEDIFE
jgi:serine/threonine protein kinase